MVNTWSHVCLREPSFSLGISSFNVSFCCPSAFFCILGNESQLAEQGPNHCMCVGVFTCMCGRVSVGMRVCECQVRVCGGGGGGGVDVRRKETCVYPDGHSLQPCVMESHQTQPWTLYYVLRPFKLLWAVSKPSHNPCNEPYTKPTSTQCTRSSHRCSIAESACDAP